MSEERWIETLRTVVSDDDIDLFGHMTADRYLRYGSIALIPLYAAIGLPIETLMARRLSFVAVEQTLRYRREMKAYALLTVSSRIVAVERKVLRITHRIGPPGPDAVACEIDHVAVCFDLDARRSMDIPQDIREYLDP